MNPMNVAAARGARLAREARTPVYTTATPARQHFLAVEVENDMGHRSWSKVREDKLDEFVAGILPGDGLSDVDHHAFCWCNPA